MLRVSPDALIQIATANGWIHDSGRLAGTINTTKMANGLGVSVTTVIRAYDEGSTGLRFLEKLQESSGMPLDDLVVKVAA